MSSCLDYFGLNTYPKKITFHSNFQGYFGDWRLDKNGNLMGIREYFITLGTINALRTCLQPEDTIITSHVEKPIHILELEKILQEIHTKQKTEGPEKTTWTLNSKNSLYEVNIQFSSV